MSGAVLVALIATGLAIVVVRRRSVAIVLAGVQTLVLAGGAAGVAAGHEIGYVLPVAVLLVRAVTLPGVLAWLLLRTRERAPVVASRPALVRLLMATLAAVVAIALAPPLGIGDPGTEGAALALIVIGVAIVATRRPALFQIIGLLVAENGVYLLAVTVPGGVPAVIELGVLFDVILIVAVAVGFSFRIHRQLGSGDTELLRRLRD